MLDAGVNFVDTMLAEVRVLEVLCPGLVGPSSRRSRSLEHCIHATVEHGARGSPNKLGVDVRKGPYLPRRCGTGVVRVFLRFLVPG